MRGQKTFDLAFNPRQPRDAEGKWTKAERRAVRNWLGADDIGVLSSPDFESALSKMEPHSGEAYRAITLDSPGAKRFASLQKGDVVHWQHHKSASLSRSVAEGYFGGERSDTYVVRGAPGRKIDYSMTNIPRGLEDYSEEKEVVLPPGDYEVTGLGMGKHGTSVTLTYLGPLTDTVNWVTKKPKRHGLVDLAFDPNQPRDRRGRWSKVRAATALLEAAGLKVGDEVGVGQRVVKIEDRFSLKDTPLPGPAGQKVGRDVQVNVPGWARGYELQKPIRDLPEGWKQVDPFTAFAPDTALTSSPRATLLRKYIGQIRNQDIPHHPLFFKDDHGNTVVVEDDTAKNPYGLSGAEGHPEDAEIKFTLKNARAAYEKAAALKGAAIGDPPPLIFRMVSDQTAVRDGADGVIAYVAGGSTDTVQICPSYWGVDSSKPGNDLYSEGRMEQLGEDNWFADADLGYMGGPEEETPEGLGVYLLTHEIGHVNDNRRGDVTGQMSVDSFGISSSASMGLWERAGKRLSGYAKTAPWEAYAEAFAAFLKGSRGRAVLAYAREYGWGDYAK